MWIVGYSQIFLTKERGEEGSVPNPFGQDCNFGQNVWANAKYDWPKGGFMSPRDWATPTNPCSVSLKSLDTKPPLGRCYIVTTTLLGHLVFYIWSVQFQVISLPWTVLGVTSKNVWKIFQSALTSNLFEWGEKPRQSNFELSVTLEFLQKLKEGNGKCPKPFWPGLWVW